MGIKTTYTCDRCGHSQDTGSQMWHVGAGLSESSYGDQTWSEKKLWCRTCCEEFHLLKVPASISTAHVPPEKPTFEELLRAIIAEEIEARTGAC